MTSSPLSAVSVSTELPFRGFSCPYEPFDESFLQFLITEQALCVGRILLDRYQADLAGASKGLTDAIRRWLDGEYVIPSPIDPAFGETRWAIGAGDPVSRIAAAAGLALYLGAEGMPAAWSAHLGNPRTLRWGDVVLPMANEISVDSDGTHAQINMQSAGRTHSIHLQRGESEWQVLSESGGCSAATRAPVLVFDGWRITFLPRNVLEMKLPEQALSEAVESIEPEMMEVFRRAVTILQTYVPAYVPWVGRVLSHAFLLHPQRGYVESGSVEDYFGFSHFSAYGNAAGLAELLIHEASHQYFNVLRLLGPFDDGSDTKLYYSTAKRTERPIDRLGVAYHAFANVLIYYRACVAGGIDDDGWCTRHLERWTEDLRVLEQPLRGNPALTAIGRSLCDPLIERLRL